MGNSNRPPITSQGCWHVSWFWSNFCQRPVDYIMSVLFSILLIGIFVAGTTGSVLSGYIVSDTLALVASKQCDLLRGNSGNEASEYSKNCYRTAPRQDGCNFFYNQSIAFTENFETKCPFTQRLCAFKNESGATFDTGLLDTKYLGINSPARLHFRQRSTCHPLKADGTNLRSIITNSPYTQMLKIGKYLQMMNPPPTIGTIRIM